jgi:molecular chaperone GrpE (heat shock protein)
MRADSINNPEHWRKRAEEMRLLANQMKDEDSKQAVLRIAAEYDHLAQRAEQRTHGLPPPI